MERLIEPREGATVGDVVDHLRSVGRPRVPDAVERRDRELQEFDPEPDTELPRTLTALRELRAGPYQETVALRRSLSGHTPFETRRGVKGAEFENALVVVGRGWTQYNSNQMLEPAKDPARVPANKRAAFERTRNLSYVTCSRPKSRLAVFFTQQLSAAAMETVSNWFGNDTVEALNF